MTPRLLRFAVRSHWPGTLGRSPATACTRTCLHLACTSAHYLCTTTLPPHLTPPRMTRVVLNCVASALARRVINSLGVTTAFVATRFKRRKRRHGDDVTTWLYAHHHTHAHARTLPAHTRLFSRAHAAHTRTHVRRLTAAVGSNAGSAVCRYGSGCHWLDALRRAGNARRSYTICRANA
jgi:hypothetical protein